MLEEFVSHEIATEYPPVEVEFSSQGSDQPRLLESRNLLCSLYFIALHTIKLLSNDSLLSFLEILNITI